MEGDGHMVMETSKFEAIQLLVQEAEDLRESLRGG